VSALRQPATRAPRARRDAVRNHQRVLAAAREVLGESGADASMEEIAARAGVGVGTVYRRFTSKDALIDELLRLALEQVLASTERALARPDGQGLEELLRALGQSFADHARYAGLLLQRHTADDTARQIRAAIDELTARALTAHTVNPGITSGDVLAVVWAMRGLGAGHRRSRSGGLATVPRHPTRRHAGTGAARRHTAPSPPGSSRNWPGDVRPDRGGMCPHG